MEDILGIFLKPNKYKKKMTLIKEEMPTSLVDELCFPDEEALN